MKFSGQILALLALLAGPLDAETLEVYRCVTEPPQGQGDAALISVGERLGQIEVGVSA